MLLQEFKAIPFQKRIFSLKTVPNLCLKITIDFFCFSFMIKKCQSQFNVILCHELYLVLNFSPCSPQTIWSLVFFANNQVSESALESGFLMYCWLCIWSCGASYVQESLRLTWRPTCPRNRMAITILPGAPNSTFPLPCQIPKANLVASGPMLHGLSSSRKGTLIPYIDDEIAKNVSLFSLRGTKCRSLQQYG